MLGERFVPSLEAEMDILTDECCALSDEVKKLTTERDEARDVANRLAQGWTLVRVPEWLKVPASIWARYEKK